MRTGGLHKFLWGCCCVDEKLHNVVQRVLINNGRYIV